MNFINLLKNVHINVLTVNQIKIIVQSVTLIQVLIDKTKFLIANVKMDILMMGYKSYVKVIHLFFIKNVIKDVKHV